MSDISVTASSVVSTADNSAFETRIAGTSITAGQPLCMNDSTGKVELADANGASAYMKTVIGISLHAALTNQPIRYQYVRGTSITFNAVLTSGVIYVLSATAGGICPAADLATGHTVCILGVASSTTVLRLTLDNTGCVV